MSDFETNIKPSGTIADSVRQADDCCVYARPVLAQLREQNIKHEPLEQTASVTYSNDTVFVDIPPEMDHSTVADKIQAAMDYARKEKLRLLVHSRLGQLQHLEAAIQKKIPQAVLTNSTYELEMYFQQRTKPARTNMTQEPLVSSNIGSQNKTIIRLSFNFPFQSKK